MTLNRRNLLIGASALGLFVPTKADALFPRGSGASTPAVGAGWKPLKLGAGGFVTGLDISPDGLTRVIRTDVGGGYIWDATADKWQQLITTARGFSGDFEGVWEVRSAPSNSAIIYLVYQGDIYKSTDRAVSFSKLTGWTHRTMDPNFVNDISRLTNPKMAIDPLDPNHVIVHTYTNGLYRTTDGGANWAATSLPTTTAIPGTINFDTGSAASGGHTGTIYASSNGTGLYKSVDGGASWSAVSGSPTTFYNTTIGTDGTLYTMGNPNVAPYQPALKRLVGGRSGAGTWTDITPAAMQWDALAVDPSNYNRLLYFAAGGYARFSANATTTASWSASINTVTRDSTGDVPWLSWTDESYMSSAGFTFDPVVPGRVWFAQGIGVWYGDFGAGTPSSINWHSQSRGIEELVVNQIIKPPGNNIFLGVWDRRLFRTSTPDVYPSRHYPVSTFSAVWSVDVSPFDPNFLVICDQWSSGETSSKSSDGGNTWTAMPALGTAIGVPGSGYFGGHIAVGSATNFIYVPGASGFVPPYYTKDGGSTWAALTLPSSPGTGGWSNGQFCKRHICDADKVTAGKFYLYNSNTGLYVSTNNGDTWTLISSVTFGGALTNSATQYHAKLRAMPGQANTVFFTSGADGQAVEFIRTTNGGSTWSVVNPIIQNVYAFGFGKAATGQSYPAIYVYGQKSGVYGIHQSDDNGATWTTLAVKPSIDTVTTVEGDPDVYGTVYVGHSGTGALYNKI